MNVREVREVDLPAVSEMIDDFVKGHIAEHRPRSPKNLRAAYLGERRVANLVVAERGERVVGMVEWSLFYDAFWSLFGVRGEWLYVRPEARGFGISAALVAEICARGRREGAEFLRTGAYTDEVAKLYERCAIGGPSYECHVSAEAFHVLGIWAESRSARSCVGYRRKSLARCQLGHAADGAAFGYRRRLTRKTVDRCAQDPSRYSARGS